MVVILTILTIAVLVLIDLLRYSRKRSTAESPTLRTSRTDIHHSVTERYFHPGHSWATTIGPESVFVGVDDFAQRVIGRIDSIDLPEPGAFVKQGGLLSVFHHGKKSLAQVAPLSGTIRSVNDSLRTSPSMINDSPYDKGWVATIKPCSLSLEKRNLLKGVVAERWLEAVRVQFVQWFRPSFGTVLQDGGQMIDNISDLLSDEDWLKLKQDFFPSMTRNASLNEIDKGDHT